MTRSKKPETNAAETDRRAFIRTAGLGIAGAGAVAATAAAQPIGSGAMGGGLPANYPAKPPGMHPIGQLDGRYPVAYEVSMPETYRLLVQFMAGLARRDLKAMAATMHFPFGIYEGTDPIVIQSAEQFIASPPKSLNVSGRGESEVQAGSYDILDNVQVMAYCPVACGAVMSFDRFNAMGQKLVRCDGIYAITNNDGKWGIELMSTIYTPRDSIGLKYNDAEEASLRGGRDWMLGYTLRSQALLNSTRRPRKFASIEVYGPRERAGNARAGDPMKGYSWRGIKSRLRTGTSTQAQIDRSDANFPQFAEWAGGGVGKWEYTVNLPDAKIIHAGPNKAHSYSGYHRYTGDHQLISETRSLGVETYIDNEWSGAGFLGNTMLHHDLTNSMPRR